MPTLRNPLPAIGRMVGNAQRAARLDPATRRFIRHNHRRWTSRRRSGPEVLLDPYNIPQSTLTYSYLANRLLDRHQAQLVVFGTRPLLRQLDLWRVFRSFGAVRYVQADADGGDAARTAAEARSLLAEVQTKRELFDLEVDGVQLGEDVYMTYLRRFSAATVDFADPRLEELLAEAVGFLRFWQRYLDTHDVRALVVSHDCYVENNVLCKLAYQRGIPAYLPHIHRLVRLDRPNSVFLGFPHYPKLFAELPPEIQDWGIEEAARRLGRRLEGDRTVTDIVFTGHTAFSLPDTGTRVLQESDRLKVLIAAHCFFDNPHVFGGMLFVDFAEWLDHLGRFAETTDHDWYLKLHPQNLPGTEEILEGILARNPRITLIPESTSHHQLVREGIDIVLTCYGSVGEEYPLLGVPVLTAGYHPRIAYGFNHNVASLEEYDEKLRDLPALAKATLDERDVFEFYFMHHVLSCADDLILDSWEGFARGRSWDDQLGTAVYDHFLDRWDDEVDASIVRRIDEYLDSGCRYRFRFGPTALPGDPVFDDVRRPQATVTP